MTVLDNQKFKFVCEACGSLTIKLLIPTERRTPRSSSAAAAILRAGRWQLFVILPGRAEATLFEMAAASATLEEAAATFGTSVEPIEKKAESLGIQLRRRGGQKRPSVRL